MSKKNYIILYIPHPTKESAIKTAELLVREKLIACGNIIDNITSIYDWKGKVENEKEVILLGKTKKELFPQIEEKVKKIHPYDIPAILTYSIENANQDYLSWIDSVTLT